MSKETRKFIKVSDVMTPRIETIDGLDTVDHAINQMREKGFGSLIIERRDESDEYGLVTVQHIARHVIEANLSPERISVYEIMEKPVLTVDKSMNIRYAIRLMERLDQLRCLVIDNGKAVGIVTMFDMVIHYMDEV